MAVKERFGRLRQEHIEKVGKDLIPPESLAMDFARWRSLLERHATGDFRHTEAELTSTKTIAQWTLDLHCDLVGKERIQLNWR